MFKKPNGQKVRKYRIRQPFKPSATLTNANLWAIPRPEYLLDDYPDMVLSIIENHPPSISYEKIKEILAKHKVPNDLGFVLDAVRDLLSNDKIIELKKYTYALKPK